MSVTSQSRASQTFTSMSVVVFSPLPNLAMDRPSFPPQVVMVFLDWEQMSSIGFPNASKQRMKIRTEIALFLLTNER